MRLGVKWVIGCAAVLVIAAAGGALAQSVKPLKLNEFTGYWSGVGMVTWTNGSTEQLKCVATYKNAATDVRQNLRCASPGYAISASADLKVEGADITGTWEEKTYSANGLITGKVTDTGFLLSIKGPTFSADMNLNHTACKQAIDIAPTGVDVSKISIGLGKC
jgi:hypothetical protein